MSSVRPTDSFLRVACGLLYSMELANSFSSGPIGWFWGRGHLRQQSWCSTLSANAYKTSTIGFIWHWWLRMILSIWLHSSLHEQWTLEIAHAFDSIHNELIVCRIDQASENQSSEVALVVKMSSFGSFGYLTHWQCSSHLTSFTHP